LKKFLSLLFVFAAFLFQSAFASNIGHKVTFIYLNGSNTNTEKSKEDYIKGVNKLHKQIVKRFDKDRTLQNNIWGEDYTINEEPIAFYWGDLSKNAIYYMEEDFDFLSAISPKPAQYVRKFIAMCLHDAIWVSRMQNMYPIIERLHNVVMEENKKGNKVVLLGYSAGTFIVHEYLFLKVPVISFDDNTARNKGNLEYKNYIKSKNVKNTCADAFFKTNILTYNLQSDFVIEDDINSFKKKADKLESYTEKYCAPTGVLAGGINFASPFALFYSGIFNEDYKITDIMAYSYKYIARYCRQLLYLKIKYHQFRLQPL